MAVEPVDERRELLERAADRPAGARREFSISSQVVSEQRSSTARARDAARSRPASKPEPRCDPTWKTTPSAPIAQPASTVLFSVETDFS